MADFERLSDVIAVLLETSRDGIQLSCCHKRSSYIFLLEIKKHRGHNSRETNSPNK